MNFLPFAGPTLNVENRSLSPSSLNENLKGPKISVWLHVVVNFLYLGASQISHATLSLLSFNSGLRHCSNNHGYGYISSQQKYGSYLLFFLYHLD